MRKTFLTPGWAIAAILVAAFSYFAFSFLAPWQLGKNERLVERNEHISAAFEHEPIPYAEVAPGGTLDPSDEWTRVTMTGHYLAEGEVLLRLRPVEKTPAFQVLTPFAVDGGPTFVVNRGWVPADKGGTVVPSYASAPPGTVTIAGMLRVDEPPHPSAPMTDQGHHMVYAISSAQVAEASGLPLAPSYLQLSPGEPGVLEAIPLPALETGNHLSYGLQWIAFGIMAPAGLIYFIVAEARERRRFAAEQDELRADIPAAGGPDPAVYARERYAHARRNPWSRAYDREEERG
ncbi:SURF1 family protein [Corynebacterium liangguodongii]|uniref:SURF1-like protein n=1 Tax=Corynebacterium liangguodongii TaxID=2079535 RepID=A0A2S0WF58_9CORY|nr:SURF1 family protein [Corynebacterium liangguodongii]AWB84417.1 hypothetical protein C3E79_07920 [Corynebacterium liangguodongii]PWB99907.1 SURF1 family protein [Corynebacterium liangguodongii]